MPDIRTLTRNEQVFLAGCIKSLILADGRIGDEEVSTVDRIVNRYGFEEYESALTEFENELDRRHDIWELAREIDRPDARNTILTVLDEVSVQDGFRTRGEDHLMRDLETIWNV